MLVDELRKNQAKARERAEKVADGASHEDMADAYEVAYDVLDCAIENFLAKLVGKES